MQTGRKFRFPLGGDLYAYVNTRQRDGVKIHIRHFQLSMDTKGGVKPTTRGVKMDAKTLRRLFAMKKQLTDEFKLQTANAFKPREKKDLETTPSACEPQQQQQQQQQQTKKKKKKKLHLQLAEPASSLLPPPPTPTPSPEHPRQQRTWPDHLLESSQTQCDNVNNYPAAFLDVGALTPTYSHNST